MAGANQEAVRPDSAPTAPLEELPDLLAAAPSRYAPQAVIARAIQRDGAALGVDFDDAFAAELADAVCDALGDDELAAIDLASFVFDADMRRALAG